MHCFTNTKYNGVLSPQWQSSPTSQNNDNYLGRHECTPCEWVRGSIDISRRLLAWGCDGQPFVIVRAVPRRKDQADMQWGHSYWGGWTFVQVWTHGAGHSRGEVNHSLLNSIAIIHTKLNNRIQLIYQTISLDIRKNILWNFERSYIYWTLFNHLINQ
jgi:hypothetical protein